MTKTYLRDVPKHQIAIYLDEDDYYISVKKLIKVDKKFVLSNGLVVMDDNYYVFEVVPKNKNYAMRLFLDDKKKPLEYYFDICKNNGLSDDLVPFYDDLYLDITYLDGEINILDEDELDEALKIHDITNEDYELVMNVRDILLEEIKNGTNELMKIDYNKYLF